ncbi:MAG: hypothetical protein KQH53_00240 [Desulfarculaceae bacterium]|nr:hypothetical protein [Desulfarculaceae bacterium]
MKLRTAARAFVPLLTGLALMAGCSAMVTTAEVPVPSAGPQIKAGLKAVMPPVNDKRFWPVPTPEAPDPNVHIFGPAITAKLRSGLTSTGLFAALPAPDAPGAGLIGDKLDITINQFALEKLGNNPWSAGAYIVDGLIQPVSGVVLIASKGQVDTGAYLLPSTRMGTSINADLAWSVKGLKEPAFKRSYQVVVELGSISERELRTSLANTQGYGVKVGQAEGQKALDGLVQAISRDPHWMFLNTYVRIAQARQVINDKAATPVERMEAARSLLGLLTPLAYTPAEAKVLRDGVLDASGRAGVANELRARYFGKNLPAGQKVTPAQAAKLFNDPAVARAMAQGELSQEIMQLIMSAMTPRLTKPLSAPPAPKPLVGGGSSAPMLDSAGGSRNPAPGALSSALAAPAPKAKPGPPEKFSPQARQMQAQLAAELAKALQNHIRLQAVYLVVADESVGVAWAPAKMVLQQISSPQVKTYLTQREAS